MNLLVSTETGCIIVCFAENGMVSHVFRMVLSVLLMAKLLFYGGFSNSVLAQTSSATDISGHCTTKMKTANKAKEPPAFTITTFIKTELTTLIITIRRIIAGNSAPL
jgi:hypothetical protein